MRSGRLPRRARVGSLRRRSRNLCGSHRLEICNIMAKMLNSLRRRVQEYSVIDDGLQPCILSGCFFLPWAAQADGERKAGQQQSSSCCRPPAAIFSCGWDREGRHCSSLLPPPSLPPQLSTFFGMILEFSHILIQHLLE